MAEFNLADALKQAEAEGRVTSTRPVKLPAWPTGIIVSDGETSTRYQLEFAVHSGQVTLDLPWPPTGNLYYRRVGNKTLISAKGRRFRKQIARDCRGVAMLTGRLSVTVEAFPPDRRRRDLDNLNKALLDALQKASVYEDDEQIDELTIRRCKVVPGGMVRVFLRQLRMASG